MRGLHLKCTAEPIFDAHAMIMPALCRIDAGPKTIVLKAFAVFGERDAARVVLGEARAVEPLMGPPNLSCVEARIPDGARREQLGVERGRLEYTQAGR